MSQLISNFFKFRTRKTSFKNEFIGGIVTFFAMLYILPVNASILSDNGQGIPYGGVLIATAIIAAIGSIMMGLYSNIPVGIAPGMGSNIFFVNTMMHQFKLSWQMSLAIVIINGFVFTMFVIMGIINKLIDSIPKSLKNAFIFGLGLYLAYIGLKKAGIARITDGRLELGSFQDLVMILTILGICLIFILYALNIKTTILITLTIMTFTGLILGQILGTNKGSLNSFSDIKWNAQNINAFTSVFGQGFLNIPRAFQKVEAYISLLALFAITISGCSGALLSTSQMIKFESQNKQDQGLKRGLVVSGVSSTLSGIIGTSPAAGYLESNAGVVAGARTGLSSVLVGILFIIAIPFMPILKPLFNHHFVTSPVLVLVGYMMSIKAKNIVWEDKLVGASSFILVIIMIFTASILNGLAFGMVFYVLLSVVSKQPRKINLYTYLFATLFLSYLIVMPFMM